MKNFTFILICLLAAPGLLMAQWKSVDLGTGQKLKKIHVIDDQSAIIIGVDTALLKSADGGDTWNKMKFTLPADLAYDFNGIDFADNQVGFIITPKEGTENGIMLKSIDAGETWNEVALSNFSDGTGSDLTDPLAGVTVEFGSIKMNGDVGYVSLKWTESATTTKHSYIFKTTDKGLNWNIVGPDLGSKNVFAIDCIGDKVYVGGNSSLLITSDDAFASWTDKTNSAFLSVTDFHMVDADKVYLATLKGIFYTENSGTNVTSLNALASWSMLYFADENILFSGNGTSNTVRSIDGGTNWELATIGQTGIFWSTGFFNNTIYGLSDAGIINKLNPNELKDPVIEFSHIFKGSEAQFTNESENCGTYTWKFTADSSSNETNPIYRFADYETHTIMLTGSNAVAEDSVKHDLTVSEPTADFTYYTEDGNNVFFTNASKNCANFEWNFGELSGSNEELTTSHVYSSFGTYTVTLTADNYIETISVEKEVTIDSVGAYWSKNQLEISEILQKMHVFNDEIAIAVGNGTTIIKSANGGDSWAEVNFPVDNDGHVINDIIFFDDNNGLISASASGVINGFMLQTSDQGENWTALSLSAFSDGSGDETIDPVAGSKVYFYSMEQIDANTALVVLKWVDASNACHGFVYKTTDKGATWAKSSNDIYQENIYTSVITDMSFAPEGQIGFITGNKFLLKTEDGGSTWTNISNDAFGYINEVLVLNNDTILAATGIGVIKTTDRFANYAFKTSDYTFDIISLGEDKFMAGKDAATLGVTEDLCENWVNMGNGLSASFFELSIFNNKIYAFSSKGLTSVSYIDNYNAPVLDFEFSIDDLAVTFTNTSENILTCEWSFGDSEISTELSIVHNYADYGTYTVELNGTNRCKKATPISKDVELVEKTTGIETLEGSAVKMYPNPVSDKKLYIDLGSISDDINVEIYNTEGRQLLSERFSFSSLLELDINMNKGFYFVKVSNNKDINHTMKLIVR